MGKRSPGHIEQLPSGSWRVKVYGGADPLTGREIRLRKTCKTERAAQIELGKLLEQAEAGREDQRDYSFSNLMDIAPADQCAFDITATTPANPTGVAVTVARFPRSSVRRVTGAP
jgi:hypothetical protein